MRALLLKVLKLDERPEPPAGATGEVSMFRASPRYFWYSSLGWAAGQVGALVGILFSFGVLDRVAGFRVVGMAIPDMLEDIVVPISVLGFDWQLRLGSLFNGLAIVAAGVYLVQLVIGFLLLRLTWEMRWYIVTDTALRIREGLLRTREQTLTIAKIQNMRTRQGPLQRLFGIADLEVQTAGGGSSGGSDSDSDQKSARMGRFRGLEDVETLRDRLRRLQARQRGSGVDDLDSRPRSTTHSTSLAPVAEAMLTEARGVRAALESRADPAGPSRTP